MKRRTCLKTLLAAGAGSVAAHAAATSPQIQIHCDLAVDPAKEKEMLRIFETVFRPTAAKFAGYIDVKMLKIRTIEMGSVPKGVNYRFVLQYQNAELRKKWIDSPEHKKAWPMIENTLASKNYTCLLLDVAA
jgi:antibiotic biosynthesis monooxygenase (ABM) superfamily enzyme